MDAWDHKEGAAAVGAEGTFVPTGGRVVSYQEVEAVCERMLAEVGAVDRVNALAVLDGFEHDTDRAAVWAHVRAWKQARAVRVGQRLSLDPGRRARVLETIETLLGEVLADERAHAQRHWGERLAAVGRDLTDTAERLSAAEDRIELLQQSASVAMAERDGLIQESQRAREDAAHAEGRGEELTRQLHEARARLAEARAESAAQRDATVAATTEVRALRDALERERAAAARLRGERDALVLERESERAEVARLGAELQAAHGEMERLSAALLDARHRAETFDARDRGDLRRVLDMLASQREATKETASTGAGASVREPDGEGDEGLAHSPSAGKREPANTGLVSLDGA